jgi:hypothetical protein
MARLWRLATAPGAQLGVTETERRGAWTIADQPHPAA